MTVWLLIYLLFGFVMHWCFTQILHVKTNNSWRWELAATILWPVAAVCGFVLAARDRKATPLPPGSTREGS